MDPQVSWLHCDPGSGLDYTFFDEDNEVWADNNFLQPALGRLLFPQDADDVQ